MNQLKLCKFEEKDFINYFKLVSNEEVMAQITERAIPLDEARKNYRKLLDRNKKYEIPGSYKVAHHSTGEYIGLGHLTVNEKKNEEAEIGYMLVPEYWGKGYGSIIAEQLIVFAKQTNLKILTAIIDPKNIPSRKILIKQGFSSDKVCVIDGLPGEIFSMIL